MSEVWCPMCMDTLDMERLTSDIRKVTSDIRRLTSDIGHQKSDIRHRTSGIRCLTLVIRRLTSDIRLQTSHVWHLTSDLRCVTSDITHRTTLYWLINLCCLLSFPKYQYISCQPWSEACNPPLMRHFLTSGYLLLIPDNSNCFRFLECSSYW